MRILLLLLIVVTCSGCASAVNRHQALQQQLDMPIDCGLADDQIAGLESERVSAGEKFLNTLASVIPSSAIINLLSGEYSSRWQIANGNFNKQADSRIELIQQECHHNIANSDTEHSDTAMESVISPTPF